MVGYSPPDSSTLLNPHAGLMPTDATLFIYPFPVYDCLFTALPLRKMPVLCVNMHGHEDPFEALTKRVPNSTS